MTLHSWPIKKVRTPEEHRIYNRDNYPGTRQMCSQCDGETERCEDDTIWSDDGLPLCEDCYDLTQEGLPIEVNPKIP